MIGGETPRRRRRPASAAARSDHRLPGHLAGRGPQRRRQHLAVASTPSGRSGPADLDEILARFDLPFKQTDVVAASARAPASSSRWREPWLTAPGADARRADSRAGHASGGSARGAHQAGPRRGHRHRLRQPPTRAEIRRLADRLTVLRDGVDPGHRSSSERLGRRTRSSRLMVGAPTELEFPTRTTPARDGPPGSRCTSWRGREFGPVSLEVRAGEIVGVAGAEGNGQRALLRGIIGIDRHRRLDRGRRQEARTG